MLAINVATVLGFAELAVSLSTPAHINVLLEFDRNLLFSVLGLLQVFGFYVFPSIFIVLRFLYRKSLVANASDKQQ
jgi:hypothetical protein